MSEVERIQVFWIHYGIASYIDTNVSSHEGKKATLQSLAREGRRTNMYQYSKWESRFCLGLDAAKYTHRIKKSFKSKLCEIEFCTKKSASAYVYLLPGWS